MNDYEPEWLQKLKTTDPMRVKTFTSEHILAIEKEVKKMNGKAGRSMRKAWLTALAAGIAAVVIVVSGILPSGPYKGWLRDIYTGEATGGETARTDSTTDPGVGREAEIEPQPPAETVPLTGKLKDQLPFSTESEMTISVHDGRTGKDYEIPSDREYVVLQSLNGIDFSAAKASEGASVPVSGGSESGVFLRFSVDGKIYQIPYRLETNTIEWKGQSFYVDDGIMLMMHGLLLPESKLAKLDRIFEKARTEQGSAQSEVYYDLERFDISGKDYNGWEKELEKLQPASEQKYYDYTIEQMESVRQYASGITALNRAILFEDPKFEMKSGIRVGLTEAQVLEKLGEPNGKSATQWSYSTGDYERFHLYFEDGKVLYMVLTMPL